MAVHEFVAIPAQTPATVITALTTGASSTEQALGSNTIFQINATQDITIRFGVPGFSASAGATDYRIPENAVLRFDVGNKYTSFKVYNLGSTAANVYILFISKF